jgi:hypothetical protein
MCNNITVLKFSMNKLITVDDFHENRYSKGVTCFV